MKNTIQTHNKKPNERKMLERDDICKTEKKFLSITKRSDERVIC